MNPGDWQVVLFTCGVSLAAVALILIPGLALGWAFARHHWPGKSLVETLVTLPLVLPPVATGLILLKLLGRRGPLGAWLHHHGIEMVFTWKAVVVALAVMSFPLLVRSIRTAFEEVPRHLEEAAATLGKSPFRVFLGVSLPLARRGIASGLLLAFARSLGEFGATIMVAGFIPGVTETLSLSIYRSVQSSDDSRAFALVGISALIAFGAVFISNRLSHRS